MKIGYKIKALRVARNLTQEELGNKIEWIIPNAQKNEMGPIRLALRPRGSTCPALQASNPYRT